MNTTKTSYIEKKHNFPTKIQPFGVHMLGHEILLLLHAALVLLQVKHCLSYDSRQAGLHRASTNRCSIAFYPHATMLSTTYELLQQRP